MSRAPRSARQERGLEHLYRGILRDPGQGLGRYLVHSLLLHGGLVVALLVGWAQSDPPEPMVPPDAYFVSAVVLPKAKDLPDKPTYVPKKDPGQAGKKETPPPKPDEMVLPDKDEPKDEGPEDPTPPKKEEKTEEPTPPKKSRKDLLAEIGDPSDEETFATDVDGDEDAKPTALDPRFGQKMSRYDREIHDRVKERWQPGLAVLNQVSDEVSTLLSFTITETGAIEDMKIDQGSGNYSFDMSCAAALQRVGKLPPPPRAPWPVSIWFRPDEKR